MFYQGSLSYLNPEKPPVPRHRPIITLCANIHPCTHPPASHHISLLCLHIEPGQIHQHWKWSLHTCTQPSIHTHYTDLLTNTDTNGSGCIRDTTICSDTTCLERLVFSDAVLSTANAHQEIGYILSMTETPKECKFCHTHTHTYTYVPTEPP